MIDGVHSNTTSLGPRVTLDGELMLSARSLCREFVRDTPIKKKACVKKVEKRVDLLSKGLSVRPPPATIPTIPLAELLTTFLAPEGSLTRVMPSSGF